MKKQQKIDMVKEGEMRLGLFLYKFIIRILGVVIVGIFVYNTVQLGYIGYKFYNIWDNKDKLTDYVVEINTEMKYKIN